MKETNVVVNEILTNGNKKTGIEMIVYQFPVDDEVEMTEAEENVVDIVEEFEKKTGKKVVYYNLDYCWQQLDEEFGDYEGVELTLFYK